MSTQQCTSLSRGQPLSHRGHDHHSRPPPLQVWLHHDGTMTACPGGDRLVRMKQEMEHNGLTGTARPAPSPSLPRPPAHLYNGPPGTLEERIGEGGPMGAQNAIHLQRSAALNMHMHCGAVVCMHAAACLLRGLCHASPMAVQKLGHTCSRTVGGQTQQAHGAGMEGAHRCRIDKEEESDVTTCGRPLVHYLLTMAGWAGGGKILVGLLVAGTPCGWGSWG